MPRLDDRRDRERGDDRRPKDSYAPKKPAMHDYFVEGDGIDRQVLQSELCKFLGADATSKPAEYNGIRGYKIRAIRPFTSEMLVDLKQLSEQFVMEERRHPGELSWDESATARQWNHQGPPPPRPDGMPQYSSPSSSGGYVQEAMGGPSYPGGYSGGPGFPPYSGPPPMSGFQAQSGIPAGYSRDQPHYTMGTQPPPGYPQEGYHPAQGEYGAPRANQPMPGAPYGFAPNAGGPPDQGGRGGGGYYDSSMGGGSMPGGPRGPYGMPEGRQPPNAFDNQYRQPAQEPGYRRRP